MINSVFFSAIVSEVGYLKNQEIINFPVSAGNLRQQQHKTGLL